MAAEVSVTTDPLLVYCMVGLLLGALVLALLFSLPRRGLGAVQQSDVPEGAPTDEPWMPGTDIFGRDREASAAPAPTVSVAPSPAPSVAVAPPPATTPVAPPAVHDPWSTGANGPAGAPPPWAKR